MLITLPLLTPAEFRQARQLLAGAPWSDGCASAGDQAMQVKRNEQLPPDCEVSRQLQALITAALDRSPQFLAAALPSKLFPPRFNRYSGDTNHYGPHVDNAIRFADRGLRVRTDLSCTVFLAEPDEYGGGELVVHGAEGERRVKLPAGQAVLYPGTSVHEVTPVTHGARLASFFWIQSMVRSDAHRRLLFELDTTIQDLAAERGQGDDAVVRLTGTYHNLLREWAEC